MSEQRLAHPEHPGQPYTLDDALYDLQETRDMIGTIERRAVRNATIMGETRAAGKKLARVQRFLEEQREDEGIPEGYYLRDTPDGPELVRVPHE